MMKFVGCIAKTAERYVPPQSLVCWQVPDAKLSGAAPRYARGSYWSVATVSADDLNDFVRLQCAANCLLESRG